MAKILCLQKLKELLDKKEQEMISRGVKTLKELDAAQALETAKLTRQEAVIQSLGKASLFLNNPTLDPKAFSGLPDSFQASLSSVATSRPNKTP